MDYPLSKAAELDLLNGRFTDGVPGVTPASIIPSGTTNDIIDEILAVQVEGGVVKDENNKTQLKTAIKNMIEARVGDYALDTGAANAYVVAMNPVVSAYTNGMEVKFRVKNANTGACTLNAGGGPAPLVRGDGTPLVAGDLPLNALVSATYDSVAGSWLTGSGGLTQSTEAVLGSAKVATQAQTNAGTEDSTIVTPKKLRAGFAASLGANGYVAFPSWLGGWIIQWGTVSVPQGQNAAFSYPIAFPTAAHFAVCGNTVGQLTINLNYSASLGVITNPAGVTVYNNGTAGNQTVPVFAIGN